MRTNDKFILDAQGEPVPEHDLEKWAVWFETTDRRVACTRVGLYRVSTVFLGLDHSFSGAGPPVLWECMIFCGRGHYDIALERCSGSREQAEAMHRKGCKHARIIRHSYFVSHPSRKRRRHIARQMARR